MQSLVILGCGYVGTALAHKAQSEGVAVTAVTRNAETLAGLKQAGIATLQADLTSDAWASQLPSSVDAVVTCISASGGSYASAYVTSQKRIGAWMRSLQSAPAYVYTSSTGVYPDRAGEWVSEPDASAEATPNARILMDAEALAAELGSLSGQWHVLRLAGIYGPGRGYLLKQLREKGNRLPGYGDAYVNLIHRDDIVSALWAVLTQGTRASSGCYNVTDRHPATKQTIVAWLCEQLGLDAPVFDPTMPSVRRAARQSPSGRMPNRRVNAERFAKTFGWQPRYATFRDGFADLINR